MKKRLEKATKETDGTNRERWHIHLILNLLDIIILILFIFSHFIIYFSLLLNFPFVSYYTDFTILPPD